MAFFFFEEKVEKIMNGLGMNGGELLAQLHCTFSKLHWCFFFHDSLKGRWCRFLCLCVICGAQGYHYPCDRGGWLKCS